MFIDKHARGVYVCVLCVTLCVALRWRRLRFCLLRFAKTTLRCRALPLLLYLDGDDGGVRFGWFLLDPLFSLIIFNVVRLNHVRGGQGGVAFQTYTPVLSCDCSLPSPPCLPFILPTAHLSYIFTFCTFCCVVCLPPWRAPHLEHIGDVLMTCVCR